MRCTNTARRRIGGARRAEFTYETYNRAHEVKFGGGEVVPWSAAPEFKGDAERVNPEEAYVASLSTCHMLTFLAIAARKRFVVDSYMDEASGVMEKNEGGKYWVSRVTLRPNVTFSGDPSTIGARDVRTPSRCARKLLCRKFGAHRQITVDYK